MQKSYKSKVIGRTRHTAGAGFTLVETLVAIAILMISIAGPLVIASKGLRSAIYARDQMTATFLAQESMEVIKNMRDNNIRVSGDETTWLNGLSYNINTPSSGTCYDSTHGCDASAIDSPAVVTSCGSGCQLVITGTGYSNSLSAGPSSIFKRLYYFTHPAGYPDNEVRVTVSVLWNEGTIPNEIDLSSELVATKR